MSNFFGFREFGAMRAMTGIEAAFDGPSVLRSLYEQAVGLLRAETVVALQVIGGGHVLLSGGYGYLIVVNGVVQNYLPDGARLPDLEVLSLQNVVRDLKTPFRMKAEAKPAEVSMGLAPPTIEKVRDEFRGLSPKALAHQRSKRISKLTAPEALLWRFLCDEALMNDGLPMDEADLGAEVALANGWIEIDTDLEALFITPKGSAVACGIDAYIEKGNKTY